MVVLPVAYLPWVEWFACVLRGDCVVDLGEHFVKRSERNRTRIAAPDGVLELTAQVRRADRPRQPLRDVRLDYSKRWQHRHWGALVSCYRSSPYFDHYAERLEPFYRRTFEFLVDYDLALIETLCSLARIAMPRLSEHYVEAAPGDLDLRPRKKTGPAFCAEPYVQVFADRMPFVANLSFADLLFAEGPAALSVLARCRHAE